MHLEPFSPPRLIAIGALILLSILIVAYRRRLAA